MNRSGSTASTATRARTARKPLIDIDRTFAFRIIRLVNLLSKRYQASFEKQFDLTLTEWRIVCAIASQPGVSAIEVCTLTGYSEMNVSRAVRRLEKMGRATRTASDADRRRTMLELTDKGWEVYAAIIPHYVTTEHKLVRTLTREDRAKLDELLTKMMAEALDMPQLRRRRNGTP